MPQFDNSIFLSEVFYLFCFFLFFYGYLSFNIKFDLLRLTFFKKCWLIILEILVVNYIPNDFYENFNILLRTLFNCICWLVIVKYSPYRISMDSMNSIIKENSIILLQFFIIGYLSFQTLAFI